MNYYPENPKALYYVEFDRAGKSYEFTLFKRQWMHTEKQMEEFKTKDPENFPWLATMNEIHPWNIFTAPYGPPGSMPDEEWVRFMVDSLNAGATLLKENYGTGCELDKH